VKATLECLEIIVSTRTIAVACLVGIGVTIVASLSPATAQLVAQLLGREKTIAPWAGDRCSSAPN
jgi:hypothetical protein